MFTGFPTLHSLSPSIPTRISKKNSQIFAGFPTPPPLRKFSLNFLCCAFLPLQNNAFDGRVFGLQKPQKLVSLFSSLLAPYHSFIIHNFINFVCLFLCNFYFAFFPPSAQTIASISIFSPQ